MLLKTKLKEILDNPLKLHETDIGNLINEMLDNIGSLDSELRDTLIYRTYSKLISENYLNEKQMEHLLRGCLDKLFTEIGKKESDSVFTRSFSALVIAHILLKDSELYFLNQELLDEAIKKSICYLNLEEDVRGFVKEKGWAHSIAHGADLLTEAIKHPYFNLDLSSNCLETIKICLFNKGLDDISYIDDEEERLIFAIEALMDKGISEDEINDWIHELSRKLDDLLKENGFNLTFFRKRTNVIHLLRGLYFRLLFKKRALQIQKSIIEVLEHWHDQLYGTM